MGEVVQVTEMFKKVFDENNRLLGVTYEIRSIAFPWKYYAQWTVLAEDYYEINTRRD